MRLRLKNSFWIVVASLLSLLIALVVKVKHSPWDKNYFGVEAKKSEDFLPTKSQRLNEEGSSLAAKRLRKVESSWSTLREEKKAKGLQATKSKIVSLAEESVKELGCSLEMLSLLSFLEDNSMHYEANFVRRGLKSLLSTNGTVELRENLISVLVAREGANSRLSLDLQSWFFSAAEGCSNEEWKDFHSQIDDRDCRNNAFFGWANRNAREHPYSAFSKCLDIMVSDGLGSSGEQVLVDVVKKFPMGVDYARMENLLSLNEGSKDSMERARTELLKRWAFEDPSEAANYIMENSERISPEKIKIVVNTVLGDSKLDGEKWAEFFPNGPYFDAAASAVSVKLAISQPKKALVWANRIDDLQIRTESIRRIRESNSNEAR